MQNIRYSPSTTSAPYCFSCAPQLSANITLGIISRHMAEFAENRKGKLFEVSSSRDTIGQ